jgi:hypothetical protein
MAARFYFGKYLRAAGLESMRPDFIALVNAELAWADQP